MKSGVAPFNIPVTADDTCRSARGNIESGIATQVTPNSASRGQSLRSIVRRVAGRNASVQNPNVMRNVVISAGLNASRPIAMNRNDAPQMPPAVHNSPQSSGVNASVCVPSAVVRMRSRATP